ncbi:MAG: hypothetical protein QOG51_1058, partial [Verrucomicrobiota bacterium]
MRRTRILCFAIGALLVAQSAPMACAGT